MKMSEELKTLSALAQTALKLAEKIGAELDENRWVTLDQAAISLGEGISPGLLREKIRSGCFEYAKHYIDTSDGERPSYAVKVAALREYFETHPSERRPPA